jgi:hypothetical protein
MGALWVIYGIYRFIYNDGNVLRLIIAIGSGITLAIFPLSAMKCLNCGNPEPFERFYESIYNRTQFTCTLCNARYKLPGWNEFFMRVIVFGFGVALFGSLFYLHGFDMVTVLGDVWISCNALLILLVRFSHYSKLYPALENPPPEVLH